MIVRTDLRIFLRPPPNKRATVQEFALGSSAKGRAPSPHSSEDLGEDAEGIGERRPENRRAARWFLILLVCNPASQTQAGKMLRVCQLPRNRA